MTEPPYGVTVYGMITVAKPGPARATVICCPECQEVRGLTVLWTGTVGMIRCSCQHEWVDSAVTEDAVRHLRQREAETRPPDDVPRLRLDG